MLARLMAKVNLPRLLRRSAAGTEGAWEGNPADPRLVSMAFAFVAGWLLVWGAVGVAGTVAYLRPS